MRLNQFLSLAGVASRRKSDALIKEGQVTVNGKKAVLGDTIEPDKDIIKVGGKVVTLQSFVYYKYYKPRGVLSSMSDPHHEATLAQLPIDDKIFPIGRLDLYSEGLMLLTNDGKLAHRLAHPSFGATKEYLVTVDVFRSPKDWLYQFKKGFFFEGRTIKPLKVSVIKEMGSKRTLNVVLTEGIKREIRQMAERIHASVLELKRIRIGTIYLGDMKAGDIKPLSATEIASLKGH